MRNAVGKWNNQTQGKPVKSKFESAPMPKDAMGEAEGFDSWRNQHQHQGYSTTVSANNMQDPYNAGMPSYYGVSFPYQNVGMGGGEGHWSSGGDPMTFLGSYGQQLSSEQQHYVESSMYSGGAFGGFNQQPGYNQFYGMSDYSAWGNSSVNRKPATHGHYGYYDRDVYSDQGVDRSCVKPVEQAMQGLSIVDKSDSNPGAEGGSEYSGRGAVSDGSNIPKKTWASIASQPAKPQPKIRSKGMPPPPMIPGKHVDIGTWDSRSATNAKPMNPPQSRAPWGAPRGRGGPPPTTTSTPPSSNSNQNSAATGNGTSPQHPVLEKLRQTNEYNPKEYDLSAKNARFFVIKSYSEDDIHRSIKYGIWCSTEHGNKRLDGAFHERESKGMVLLFFSVNGSGHFCGMAVMTSPLDYNSSSSVWAQDKWKGQFSVKWIYVKDVPNAQLRNIRLENNENKPVTNSRDTQEVPFEKGKQVLKIIHNYRHSTSIFDDFIHYEQRQEECTQHAHSSEEQL